jgi:hypothetical protein
MADQDHHYVPVFYLKQWAEGDGRVPYFRWLDGRIIPGRVTPDYTGFTPNLYAQDNVPLERKHVYETQFFKMIDTKASEVFVHLVSGRPYRPSPDERVWWSAFLLAAHLRIPLRIASLKTSGSASLIHELERDPKEFESILPGTLRDWVEQHMVGLVENFGLHNMASFITDYEQIKKVTDLNWSGHSFPSSSVELITGDRPLLVFGDMNQGNFVMMMALSPVRVFVASQSKDFTKTIIEAKHSEFVRTFNTRIIERADERVYGRIERSFVERIFKEKALAAGK